MEVIEIIENDDGSATVTFDMSNKEQQQLIEYAVVHLLEDYIKKGEKSVKSKRTTNSK